MKRSKRNNKDSSSPYVQRRQTSNSSVKGLMTSKQQNMASNTISEASVYTQKTMTTNSLPYSQQYDFNDEDIQKEDMREVFVSVQQQKTIQKILEVARKGKINQKNAFQIPLKVLQNQNFSLNQTKFWKFASQLLGASINIYEKRIENTWINTNIIHDKLARMTVDKQKNQIDDQNQDNLNRDNSKQFITLSIQEFRDSKILDNVKLGEETLESIQKINVSTLKRQFTNDPLFQKKLKTFDNNSIKGLLLNVFDLSSTCEIQLFSTQNKQKPKQYDQITKNQKQFSFNLKVINQHLQNTSKVVNPFDTISIFKKQNSALNKSQGKYDSIGFLRKTTQNHEPPFFQQVNQLMQINDNNFQSLYIQLPLQNQFPNEETNSNTLKFEDNNTVNTQLPSNNQQNYFQTLSTQQQYSPMSFGFDNPYSQNIMDRSFHSVMTPLQLQFKQGKLKRKINPKKRLKKEGKTKQKIHPIEIQFDPLIVQNKKITLQQQKSGSSKISQKKKAPNQNLLPQQLSIYEKIFFKMHNQNKSASISQKNSDQHQQDLPDFLAPDPSMLQIQVNQRQDKITDNLVNQKINQMFEGQDIMILKTLQSQAPENHYKYNNIRQTKKNLFERAKQQRQLRISDIVIEGLSSANILITFLHIANQKNMIVRNSPQEDDVTLSWD